VSGDERPHAKDRILDAAYDIVTSSGEAALTLLRGEAEIDIVITDQAMPSMTGVELAGAIAREWPHIPVILATGYSELPPGSPQLPVVHKPFTERDLAREIERALRPPG
jgi:CheY-like chemotaxis protein